LERAFLNVVRSELREAEEPCSMKEFITYHPHIDQPLLYNYIDGTRVMIIESDRRSNGEPLYHMVVNFPLNNSFSEKYHQWASTHGTYKEAKKAYDKAILAIVNSDREYFK
jgi:hypothetical protein